MKVLVAVKRVIDYNVKIRVKADNTGVETANVKMSMNPFDEIAVEEAIRLREKGVATEIIAFSAGPAQCQETIRTALAMGADRGVLVADRRRAAAAGRRQAAEGGGRQGAARPGDRRQAGDRRRFQPDRPDAGRPARLVAGHLRQQAATSPTASAEVKREVDGGLENIKIKLPAVITTDLRLNEPRYASLPNIMKAKKKPIEMLAPGCAGRRRHAAAQGAQGRGAAQAQGRHQGEDRRRAGRQAAATKRE